MHRKMIITKYKMEEFYKATLDVTHILLGGSLCQTMYFNC